MRIPPSLAALLLPAALLIGCATMDPAATEFAAAARVEIARHPADFANGEARAFLVRRDGRDRGLIWGTLHVAYTADTVLSRDIRARFADSADLTEEVVLDRMAAAPFQAARARLQAANTQADPAALELLDPGTRQAMAEAGLSPADLESHSLRGLAALASRAVAAPQGPMPQFGFVDLDLIGFARSVGKPVYGLEPPLELDPTIADPNGSDAAAMLRLALRRRGQGTAFNDWLGATYHQGEVAALAGGLTAWQASQADLDRADRLRPTYLTRRNAVWLPKLERRFERPGQHFVAVGAAHLLGADGIVALLRGRGWEVMPCPADRCP